MSPYESVEIYPSVALSDPNPRPTFIAEYDDWKYTFEVHDDAIALVQITRPWQPGDPSPPDWVPAPAEERVTVEGYTRADIAAPVITALIARGVLGHELPLRIR